MGLFVRHTRARLGEERRQPLGLFPISQEFGGRGASGRPSQPPATTITVTGFRPSAAAPVSPGNERPRPGDLQVN